MNPVSDTDLASPHGPQVEPSAVGQSVEWRRWSEKLEALPKLMDGWDSYDAPSPNATAIGTARIYLAAVEKAGFEPTRIEPSVMGGVGITHRQGNRKVYVEFYNDGKVHALFSDRTPAMRTRPVATDTESCKGFIEEAREYLNG